jgi:hypothetical protein
LFSPFKANGKILRMPRCAPTKPPDPPRTDMLPRPTTTSCNTQETQGVQHLVFYIRLVLQRSLTFHPPTQLRGRPPPSSESSPPAPLTRSCCGCSRCGGKKKYISFSGTSILSRRLIEIEIEIVYNMSRQTDPSAVSRATLLRHA